jgi:hypothetical protein
MMVRIVLLAGAMALGLMTSVLAQSQTAPGDASKDLTNCPPSSAQGSTTGAASNNAQAVEKSAILPSAENHQESAAPTVQRNGQSVEARRDCPQDADQPKAGAPKG